MHESKPHPGCDDGGHISGRGLGEGRMRGPENLRPAQIHVRMPPRAYPFAAAEEHAAKNIVGTWFVTYMAGGAPAGQAYIQWHSDGTEWEKSTSRSTAATCAWAPGNRSIETRVPQPLRMAVYGRRPLRILQ